MAAYTTIDDPDAQFQTVIYTGNGSADHAITLPGDTDMSPNLVWIKNRDATDQHCMFDTTRGATKLIGSNTNAAQTTDGDTLDSFTSDGFQVDADVKVNTNTEKYVAWCWNATGSTASNTDGTNITSTVDANTTSGISIVSWTGDNSGSSTVGHGLGKVAEVVITKNLADAQPMHMKHKDMAANSMCDMDGTAAQSSRAGSTNGGLADLSGTTTFGFIAGGAGVPANNGASDAMIAYVFNSVQGFSKMGKYTGNGAAAGPFVYLGFRPAWIIIKRIDDSANWAMYDNKRSPSNVVDDALVADDTVAEYADNSGMAMDYTAQGFKIRGTNSFFNTSGSTYIYMAFAEAPLVNSEGVPCNAR